MIYNNIAELRKILIQELKNVDSSKPIKLPYDKDLVYQLLFENNRLYKMPCLEKIDFSDIDFSGIDITDFDFTGLHGVKIDPQTVKNKDFSNTICNGVEFIGPFDYVRIKNTDFTGSKGAVIKPSYGLRNLSGSKFCDVTFEGTFFDAEIAGADFTGSKGAVINLQLIRNKDARGTKFADTIIKGSFKGVAIAGADFTNVRGIKKLFKYEKGVKINIEEIQDGDLSYTVCDGVIFEGSFSDIIIKGTDFTGSKGAIIYFSYYNKFTPYDISGSKLSGVKLKGTIENTIIRGVDFTGSEGAEINPQRVPLKDMTDTICNGVTFVGESINEESSFDGVIIIGTDFTGSKGAKINPQRVDSRDFTRTKCADVKFTAPFVAAKLHYTDFTGSEGAKINPNGIDFFGGRNDLKNTILKDAELISVPYNLEDCGCVLDGCIYGVEIIEDILVDIVKKYKDSSSNIVRNKVVEELKKYNGKDKILLPFDNEMIKLILFEVDKFASEVICVLEKIDFKNVDFSGIDVSGIDFSKYVRVTINLDTIKNKDISNSNLKGVRIIGSFDGVNKTNTILDEAYYAEQSFENDFREKIKVLTLTK